MLQVKKIRVCNDLKGYMNDEVPSQAERPTDCEEDTPDVADQTADLQTQLLQEVAA